MKLFGKKRHKVDKDKLKVLKKQLASLEEDEETVEPPEEYEEPEPEHKENKKKPKEEIMGKYLLRDMPLFRYEMVGYLVIALVGFMLYMIERIGLLQGASRIIVLPAIILPLGIWFIKWALYMPRGKKVPGLKIYRSGIVELGCFDIGKGYIAMGKEPEIRRKFITKVNKHIEASTGRPFVAISELQGENIDLVRETKPDMKSEEFNAILETNTAVTTKNVMKRMMRFAQPSFTNPLTILMLINMLMVAFLIIKSLNLFGG